MAIVERVPKYPTLQMAYDLGTDLDGKKITRTRSFSNINIDVIDQDLYDVALAIVDLQTKPITHITIIEKSELMNAE